MNLLFVHQNMPGQFRYLIAFLLARGQDRVAGVGRRGDFAPPGFGRVTYDLPESGLAAPNPFLAPMDLAVRHGLQAARSCKVLAEQGFQPDLIVAHPGWGEALYMKEIFPRAPLLNYCEFFYSPRGADVNFDPADQQDLEADCVTRTRNAPLLLSLAAGDWGLSPTHWQKSRHPAVFQDRISVIFDGIDTNAFKPDPEAAFTLPDGSVARPGDEIVTFTARNLDAYRGFPSFMRAVPEILRRRPGARVVILGHDSPGYGKPPPSGGSWRDAMLAECAIDPARVFFMGIIPYADYATLLRVSAAHVHLTVPFVLSWSMLEAMSAGCAVVASAVAPVREVIEDGTNGLLADFFAPAAIADKVTDLLTHPDRYTALRQAARWTILSRYSLARCLPRHVALFEALARGETPALA